MPQRHKNTKLHIADSVPIAIGIGKAKTKKNLMKYDNELLVHFADNHLKYTPSGLVDTIDWI